MKILNFGSCNVDYVYSVDHIVNPGETETSTKLETFPGGKGLNQSIACARAGVNVYHAGCIGQGGEMLCDIMSESGVDLSYVTSVDAKNGHAIIQVSREGENSIFLYPGSNDMVTKDIVDKVLKNFSAGDIILLQNEISNVDYIIEKAFEKKLCIVLNPSPINNNIKSLDFKMLSYVILNEVEAKEISGCENAEECLTYFKKNFPELKVMLTLGSRGCVYSDKETELFQPAFKVEAVDTTAAGDTFTGYFVAGISKGEAYADILKLASAASAIAVSRMGAAPSIPECAEVVEALKDLALKKNDNKTEIMKKRIFDYVKANLKDAKLDGLAKELGYSSVYTGTMVKKLTGEAFSKLVQSERCAEGARLLLETELPVEMIISETGYENESFFRKIFKEKYGKNPLEFRKKRG